jgi:hypothetical protein
MEQSDESRSVLITKAEDTNDVSSTYSSSSYLKNDESLRKQRSFFVVFIV